MFQLAACAEMLYTEMPFLDRVERLHSEGFQIEFWDWTQKDLIKLAKTGAVFSNMSGYVRGNLTEDDGIEQMLSTAEDSLQAAEIINVARLNLHGTGIDSVGIPFNPRASVGGRDWFRAAKTLERLAVLAEKYQRVFTLENLNTKITHPGVPFSRVVDVLALVEAVDRPGLRINMDFYHAQIDEGNILELAERALPWIGEFQVSDAPGRHEPGTGEINYPHIAKTLANWGYTGVIALEGTPVGHTSTALAAFRSAFAVSE
jgi:hydroxypyruvate isomerase